MRPTHMGYVHPTHVGMCAPRTCGPSLFFSIFSLFVFLLSFLNSPLLANIYLHYALDLWAMRWQQRLATGDMIIVRYADDFIVGFQHHIDARFFLEQMRERLGRFALSLHPEKTRLIEFGRFAAERRKRRGLGKPETFNFLASPSYVAKPARANSRSNGRPDGTACERSSRWFKRKCGGVCTSRSPIRGRGCTTSSVATSITTQCRPTFGHLWHSELRSPDAGGGYLPGVASGRSSIGNRRSS